jgi:hypothetical protein
MRVAAPATVLAHCAAALIACSAYALAAPPPELVPDPALAEWFKHLRQPGTSLPCCSISDCRRVDYRRASDGRFEVMVEGSWYKVPRRLVLQGQGNPLGRAVACYSTTFGYGTLAGGTYEDDRIEILCFVPELPTS